MSARRRPPRGYRVFEREFLNTPGHQTTAAIHVQLDSADEPYGSIQISDCDRKISLQINCENYEDAMNSLHKVETMIVVLQRLRRGIKKVVRDEYYA